MYLKKLKCFSNHTEELYHKMYKKKRFFYRKITFYFHMTGVFLCVE